MKKLVYLFCFAFAFNSYSQDFNLVEKFELPTEIKETSGLIFFNNKLITHNDSGDGPNLYEIDTISGTITRTITITNATHVDWEDISQDDTHIYIADIGNNSGDRQDLKIYKILKSDYISSTSITAEIISFSYEDQTDFTSQPNNTNFDSEAISIYQGNIFIFTKNWIDFKTNAYIIPKSVGSYTAQKVSSYDVQGLITGVTYNPDANSFLFCGYDNTFTPFLFYVDQNRPPSMDIFGGSPTKIDLINDIFLEQGSQIEGIAFIEFPKYFISREFFSTVIGTTTFEFPQKLYTFYNVFDQLLSTSDYSLSQSIKIVPNPIGDSFTIVQKENFQNIQSISLLTLNGREILSTFQQNTIDWKSISKGVYLLKIQFETGKTVVKKIIKE